MNKVWESKLDGKYDCYVENTEGDGYKGFLVVEENGKELLREEVGISYGARFGPDAADVAEWEERVVNFIDNQ